MNRSKSNGIPEKSIICALQYIGWEGDQWVDYYVSDEKKFSKIGKIYKKEKWEEMLLRNNKVDNESELELKEAVMPISKIKMWDILDGSYIVFKSCLYRIGGYKMNEFQEGKASKRVSKLDLKNIDLGWVSVAEMNNGRYNPYPVILDGKLYVVGGLARNPAEETPVLMEVFKSDGSAWQYIRNPDLTVPPPWTKNEYLRKVYCNVLVGAVERKKTRDDFIFVAIHTEPTKFKLYTYRAGAKNNWKPYTKISCDHLIEKGFNFTRMKPTVVWGKVMLFLGEINTLYVMDLKKGNLHTIDLVQSYVLDDYLHTPSFLVMVEQGKFCVYWQGYSPQSLSFSVLKGCIFTLNRDTNTNAFSVIKESSFFSLLPCLDDYRLQAVCLVDYIPDTDMNVDMI